MQLAQAHSPGREIANEMSDQETNAGVDDGKNEQDNNDNKGATTEDASEPR